ncbi:transposase, partial [Rhizorhabdus wittichii]|uniref:transposase n=1 Tax=Rhizorhabdus wittichii TaxID=160791 RepID=UPI00178C6F5A
KTPYLGVHQTGSRPRCPSSPQPDPQAVAPVRPEAYKLRNLIERAFCFLKDWRRIATRYDKLAVNFEAAVAIAATILWWC